MVTFRALTYAGQYPPLVPRGPEDVRSFELLHASLRAQPELAKEGDKILNEEMLAKLVDGMRRFQRDHLGRKAKSKYWPTLCLPGVLFSDRSSYPNSPLGTVIFTAFRIKKTSPWRNFNFDNPKLFDDNIAILKRAESDLRDRGFLQRPVLYFDDTVREGLGAAEVARLTKIARRFGAAVVDDPKEVAGAGGRATHIVAYDPEEHDAPEVIAEEERRERAGEEMERTYLKTLAIADVIAGDGLAGGAAAQAGATAGTSATEGATRKMALVHWWYHPSSYDEWMPAADVSGDVENEKDHPGIPNGPAVVGCKFVRDVEKFNEWGMEADYAVMEYERKIAYLHKKETCHSKNSRRASTSSKKSNKRRSSARLDSSVLEHLEDANNAPSSVEGPATKRTRLRRNEETSDTDQANVASLPLDLSSTLSPTKAAAHQRSLRPRAVANNTKASSSDSRNLPPLSDNSGACRRQTSDRRRPGTCGMNPRRILTGQVSERGNEIFRRTVYDGALRVEEEPHRIIIEALGDYAAEGGGLCSDGLDRKEEPALGARPEWRKLLPPTGFIRPSVDVALGHLTVTELTLSEKAAASGDEEGATGTMVTVAVHRSVPVLVEGDSGMVGAGEEQPLSLRGGGGEEGEEEIVAEEKPRSAIMPVQDAGQGLDQSAREGLCLSEEAVTLPAVEGSRNAAEGVNGESGGRESAIGAAAEIVPAAATAAAGPSALHTSEAETATENTKRVAEAPAMHTGDPEGAAKGGMEEPFLASNNNKPWAGLAGGTEFSEENSHPLPPPMTAVAVVSSSGVTAEYAHKASLLVEGKGMAVEPPPAAAVVTKVGAATTVNKSEADTAAAETVVPLTAGTTAPNVNLVAPFSTALSAPTKEAVMATAQTVTRDALVAPSSAAVASAPLSSSKRTESSANMHAVADGSKKPPQQPPAPTSIQKVAPLPSGTQLSSSLYRPSASANTEGGEDTISKMNNHIMTPSWYDPLAVSDLERRALPEWFNLTAPHRSPTSYMSTRETILELAGKNPHQYITATALRRSVGGDAGSLMRLHGFLMDWGLLNGSQVGETAPSEAAMRRVRHEGEEGSPLSKPCWKRKGWDYLAAEFWPRSRQKILEASVVRNVRSSAGPDEAAAGGSGSQTTMLINWEAVAGEVGGGATPAQCQRAFIDPPSGEDDKALATRRMITENPSTNALSHLMDGVRPHVLRATLDAALSTACDPAEARRTSLVAVVASAATAKGVAAERDATCTLADIVDQRLQRLENRMALLDDVEALLEAERVALELERRELYTARCRHWFGDGS